MNPLQFEQSGASYLFVSIGSLQSFILEHQRIAKQLNDAIDKELDLTKSQTFSTSLTEAQNLIWAAGKLLNEVEAKLCPTGTESDGGEL